MSWQLQPVTVRVPATSANLGPGFDSLALALALHDVVEACVTSGGLVIEVTGAGEDTARLGERHLVVRSMRAAFRELGGQPAGLRLRCRNAIPHGYGLGSSAAAAVAGVLAARALAGPDAAERLPQAAVLDLAATLEGHADNAAACVSGGLTIAWTSPAGVRCVRLRPVAGLAAVLCIPERPLATTAARKALPDVVPHADAAQNAARAALLIAALTAEPARLLDATEDFLHQPYRAAAMPATAGLIQVLRDAGIPAVMSGAGPAVLAFTAPGLPGHHDTIAGLAAASRQRWAVHGLAIDEQGAAVTTAADGAPA
jgi:homoserine kinase